jgi:hypothetical protein
MLLSTEKGKVKLSFNKPRRLRRGIECWASIFTLTFGTTRRTKTPDLRARCNYPQGNSLVLIYVKRRVDPRPNECEQDKGT